MTGGVKRFTARGLYLIVAGTISVSSISSLTQAATVQINSFDNGWYRDDGVHMPANANIFVGRSAGVFNNFLAFDLTPVAGATITSATVTFFANGFYVGPDASETYGLFAFSGDIDALLAGTGGIAAYNNLGGGTSYGQTTLNGTPNAFTAMPQFSISLSPAALADVGSTANSIDKRFVIGGTLLTLSGGGVLEGLFGNNELFPAAQLTLETPADVPVPSALPLFVTGLAALGLVARRRKKPPVARKVS